MNLSRRTALKSICFSAAALALPSRRSGCTKFPRTRIRLGLIADVHIGFVDDAEGRLQEFLEQMAEQDPDGLIQLGDFAYPNAEHQRIVDKFNEAHENIFHTIGNHDLDLGLTKADAKESWGIPHFYYAKDLNGIRIIVLDGNDRGSPTYQTHGGYHSYVGEEQLQWLNNELESSEIPVLIVSHQPLAGRSSIDNAEQIQQLISKYCDKVIVCINGHSHLDQHVVVDGVNYVHVNSASYYWLGGKVRLAKYQDALFTTMEIDPSGGTVRIDKKISKWASETPEECGYFQEGRNRDIKESVKPQISGLEIQAKPTPVIDVFLMGGQSNMQGVGRVSDISEEALKQDRVQIYHSDSIAGAANGWVANHPCGFTDSYFGPEISFGNVLSQLSPNSNVAIIKHATGGTNLTHDWEPGVLGQESTSGIEYRKFMATVKGGLQSLADENKNAKIRVRAMFWQQGESDSKIENAANKYGENLRNLIERVRQDLDIENLPFIYGKVRDTTLEEVPGYRFNDTVIEAQSSVDQFSQHKNAMSGAHVIESADFESHGDVTDGFRDKDFAHYSSDGVTKLGEQYAKFAHQLLPVAKNRSSKTLRVISYNTYYAFDHQKQWKAGKTWVRSMSPDVVALQELTDIPPEQLRELANSWEHEHSCLLKTSGFSVGFTSREPLEVITKRTKDMHHGYLHVRCNDVHYFVVHLSPFQYKKRRQEAELLLKEIEPLLRDSKVMVLGDFNAFTPEDRALLSNNEVLLTKMHEQDAKHAHVQNLKDGRIDYSVMDQFLAAGLVDTATVQVPFTQEKRLTLPTGIWDDKKTSIKSGQRVDFILVTPNLSQQIADTVIPTEGIVNQISDHYPVVTDFRN